MEAAVPIISKALDNVGKIDEGPTRKESTLSNKTLTRRVTAIKTKQQAIILLLLILVIVLIELIYNMLKKDAKQKTPS